MAGERANRRLTAIAMADVAGYSRLMEADETGTLTILLERLRTIVEPVVGAHGGRIIKAMGDGWLIELASAVDAVTGMLELQRRMADANERGAASQRIDLRVGINLGDIISEGTDIYGDGVNIAARVEQLSEAGGICITGKVHDEVQGKVEVAFQDIGEHDLKNISRPVRVFRWSPDLAATAPQPPGRQRSQTSDRPGIAVLPFANLSGDAEQQYLCDGITEDITTELSRFRQMSVASRSSAARFRGPDVDMIRAGRELDVAFLLEGSVRRMGGRVRITAQLIDAATGSHTWGDRYDCAQDEIFDAQDHVVRTVASTVCARVAAAGLDHARRKPPASLAAYDYVLRGDALPWTTPESEAQAREMFRKAIEIDPGYARAHALLSFALSRQWLVDMSGSDALREESSEMARKAVSFDPNDTLCQWQWSGLTSIAASTTWPSLIWPRRWRSIRRSFHTDGFGHFPMLQRRTGSGDQDAARSEAARSFLLPVLVLGRIGHRSLQRPPVR